MAKHYFTKHDRDKIITLCTVEGALKETIREWAEFNRPKEWLADLRRSLGFVVRANDAISASCADQQMIQVMRRVATHKVMLLPNDEADKLLKSEKHVRIERDVVETFAEAVLEARCSGCTKTDHETCIYRNALMHAQIPPYHDPTPDDVCQYKYEKENG